MTDGSEQQIRKLPRSTVKLNSAERCSGGLLPYRRREGVRGWGGGEGGVDTCSKLDFCISVVATKKVLVRQAATVGECENDAAVWHGADLSQMMYALPTGVG